MAFQVRRVDWAGNAQQLRTIREKVFVFELNIPKRIEFDQFDLSATHVLILDDKDNPIATGRLCKDGLLGRIAVLPPYRTREVYKMLLNYLVEVAKQEGIGEVCINCILNEVDRFLAKGFVQQGHVFMEAGIPRMRLKCPVQQFDSEPFTMVH